MVVAAYFLLPALFFFVSWYASYVPGSSATVVAALTGAVALLVPALLCYRLAGRAGRRRRLWTILVLAGSFLSLWLPFRYVMLEGPLPTSSFVALPISLREVAAAALVALIPLLAGAIPIVMYGLALGLDRPMAGIPPRGALLMSASAGMLTWFTALFITLLNPVSPPFMPLQPQIDVIAQLAPAPTLPGEMVPSTWRTLLWRLHDGAPPGATEVELVEDSLDLHIPAQTRESGLLEILMGRGLTELVDVEDRPPAAGTSVSTTQNPLPGAEEIYDTLATGDELATTMHWSGVRRAEVALQDEDETPVVTVRFGDEAQERLIELAEADPAKFVSLVVDNVVVLSFPLRGAIEGDRLVIRRLDPEFAAPVAATLRYGPLPLVPAVEVAP